VARNEQAKQSKAKQKKKWQKKMAKKKMAKKMAKKNGKAMQCNADSFLFFSGDKKHERGWSIEQRESTTTTK